MISAVIPAKENTSDSILALRFRCSSSFLALPFSLLFLFPCSSPLLPSLLLLFLSLHYFCLTCGSRLNMCDVFCSREGGGSRERLVESLQRVLCRLHQFHHRISQLGAFVLTEEIRVRVVVAFSIVFSLSSSSSSLVLLLSCSYNRHRTCAWCWLQRLLVSKCEQERIAVRLGFRANRIQFP